MDYPKLDITKFSSLYTLYRYIDKYIYILCDVRKRKNVARLIFAYGPLPIEFIELARESIRYLGAETFCSYNMTESLEQVDPKKIDLKDLYLKSDYKLIEAKKFSETLEILDNENLNIVRTKLSDILPLILERVYESKKYIFVDESTIRIKGIDFKFYNSCWKGCEVNCMKNILDSSLKKIELHSIFDCSEISADNIRKKFKDSYFSSCKEHCLYKEDYLEYIYSINNDVIYINLKCYNVNTDQQTDFVVVVLPTDF